MRIHRSRAVLAALSALVVLAVPAVAQAAPYEPNDTIQQAIGPLTGGQNYDAAIETSNDVDYYYFNVAGQRQIDVAVTGLNASCGDRSDSFSLLNEDGGSISNGYSRIPGTGMTNHILLTTSYSRQFVVRVDDYLACQYRFRISPADAVTTTPPGVIASLGALDEADDIQRVFVDGQLRGTSRGTAGQSFDLGALAPASQITFEAESSTGYGSWNATITNHDGRNPVTIFTENQEDCCSGRFGIVRRVVITPSGGVLAQCGELLAPLSCIPKDGDGDGFTTAQDCNDANAAIKPGAPDRRGNGIDENCDGVDAPLLPTASTIALGSTRIGIRTRINSLVLRNTPRSFSVRVRCTGGGCRGRVNGTFRAPRGSRTLSLTSVVRGMRLRPGARISAKVYQTGYRSKTFVYRMRRGQRPKLTTS